MLRTELFFKWLIDVFIATYNNMKKNVNSHYKIIQLSEITVPPFCMFQ